MATIDFVVKNGLVVNENAVILETTDSSSKDTGALVVEGGVGIEKKLYVGTDLLVGGDVDIAGGDITTSQVAFNLINANAATVNFAGAATVLEIGAATGTTNINNNLQVDLDLDVRGGDITTNQTSFNLINTTATTGNLFGAAAAVNIGAATGTTTIRNAAVTLDGVTLNINGVNPVIASTNTGTASLFNSNITAINFGQAAAISMGSTTLNTTVRGNLVVNGNTTLGDASSDTITFNGTVLNVPNTLAFTLDDAINNNVTYPIEISHTTSLTPANNIGVGIEFITETGNNNNEIGVTVEGQAVSVAAGAENFDFVVRTMTGGATAVQALRLNNNTLTVGASSTATTITTQTSSALTVTPGVTGVTGNGNALTLRSGEGGITSGNGGTISLLGGNATTNGAGGGVIIRAGAAVGANIVGTDTIIEGGTGTGTGRSGEIVFRTGPGGTAGSATNALTTVLTLTQSGLNIPGDILISGNLTVNGATTTVNTNTLTVDDKNIELGSVAAISGLQATLTAGQTVVNLTSGTTSGLIVGTALSVTTGPGAFGAAALVTAINSTTQFTVSVVHAVSGSAIFSTTGVTEFTANGGGITLRGTTDKTFNWIQTSGHWTSNVNISAPALVSTTAIGTAPLTVTSNTVVTNLNADLLDGQQGTWYQDWANITNKPDPVITVTLTGDVSGTANTTLTDLASGTVSVATTIAANSVALGTDTTGNYVSDVAAGAAITVTHTPGEGSTATIAHTDTSTVADVAAGTNLFVTGITFDTFGHVQTITRGSPSGFLTAEADTLATVTGRGATTSTACTFSGNVNITTPANLLFGSQTRQMVNLWGTNYGIGVQSSTTYFRSDSRFSWFRAGTHNDAENNAGGGTVAMTLDSGSNLRVTGSLFATTKSFLIDHPTKPGMKLRYGSLEGPEDGVYVRGKLVDSTVIELPDYWTGLVHADSITVNLTAAGPGQQLYVEKIENNCVHVVNETGKPVNCFYTVYGERKDVDKLVVEIE